MAKVRSRAPNRPVRGTLCGRRAAVGQVPGSGVTADLSSGGLLEGLFVGVGDDGLGVGPPIAGGVEEVIGPGRGDAVVVPPAGVAAGGEDGEVVLAVGGGAHAAGSSSGRSAPPPVVGSLLWALALALARARASTSSPR